MNIQLASDLHLEFIGQRFPGERLVRPNPAADVLVLAGDIGNGATVPRLFKDWPTPIVYVAGNHEFYGHAMDPTCACIHEAAQEPRRAPFHFLDNQSLVLNGVRFLGCTLWTDYRLNTSVPQHQAMTTAELLLNDHRRIRQGHENFRAADALERHLHSRAWLKKQLAQPFDGKTVVVSHHGPHPLSVHPRFASSPINAAFVSDLSDVMPGADVWIHGHVHDSFSYAVNGCRVVANPAGYILNLRSVEAVSGFTLENQAFDPRLSVSL